MAEKMAEKKEPEAPLPQQVALVGLEEMAAMLRLPPPRLQQMVRSGQIRGVKVDGAWKFNPKLVQEDLARRARGGR